LHWLSEKPCSKTSAIHVSLIPKNEIISIQFSKQAEKDWKRILNMREKELMKGSRCVIILLGTDDDGNYLGCTSKIQGRPRRNMLETMNHIWKKHVSEKEYENTSFCN
jgi:hypothetical protein